MPLISFSIEELEQELESILIKAKVALSKATIEKTDVFLCFENELAQTEICDEIAVRLLMSSFF